MWFRETHSRKIKIEDEDAEYTFSIYYWKSMTFGFITMIEERNAQLMWRPLSRTGEGFFNKIGATCAEKNI